MTPAAQDRQDGLHRTNMPLSVPAVAATVKLDRWWKPKATNLLAVLFSVMLISGLTFSRSLLLLIPSLLTIIGIGSFGHVVNDWYDIHADAVAGKANRLAGLSHWKRYGLVAGLLAVALFPWIILPFDTFSITLLLLEFALLLAYAMPPLRLKQRQTWALFADGAYAYAVPTILAAHTFFLAAARPDELVFLGSLWVWQLALGLRHFLNHLALDRTNDIRSETPTLATRKGNRYIHGLIRRVILPIELAGFLAYLLVMTKYARFMVVFVAGLFLFSSLFHTILTLGRSYPLLSYRFSKTALDRLYQEILPLILIAYLVLADWRFCLLLVWPAIMLVRPWRWPVGRSVSSRPQKAAGSIPVAQAHGEAADNGSGPERVNIAVVNINKAKYTETFINGLISRLPYNVYYLYGGELPRFDADDRHFLSNWSSLQFLAEVLEVVLHLGKDDLLKNSVASYLQAKNISLVLAEFGPVGVEMLPITRDLGIPLVVCFHGYDAFNKETLRQYAPRYATMFREAARIVGVSAAMLERLQELGAPRDKLVHLPAFVNLELFPPTDHSALPPRFLAVGRFAESKSPHLTILAFHKVAQAIPQAVLTMIGKGGGGELFEACLILVRSLGLEDRIDFKGVVSHEEVAIEMRRARVFVQHSITAPETGDMEGKPVAVMEAMASGLPVVATRQPGIVELIENDVTGLLVDEYDVEGMAVAMIRLANDDGLVRRIGGNASSAMHDHPLISRHVEILDEIIAGSIAAG